MDDRAIVELYWRRDEAAIRESARAYGAYCLDISLRILGDRRDAEECVNDTWLRAWQAIPPQRPARLAAFFGRIARNLSLDRYAARRAAKRGGGQVELALHELEGCLAAAGGDPAQRAEDAELEAAVARFLRALPARERDVFLDRYWRLLPLREIAALRGLRPGAVKAGLHRSRGRLAAFLRREGLL